MSGCMQGQWRRLLGSGSLAIRGMLSTTRACLSRHRLANRPWLNHRTAYALLIPLSMLTGVLSAQAAPTISSVSAISGSTPSVTVTFSEPVTAATAGDKTNYSLSGGLSVINATVNNPTRVTLTTSAQSTGPGVGPLYTLTVSNVQNLGLV